MKIINNVDPASDMPNQSQKIPPKKYSLYVERKKVGIEKKPRRYIKRRNIFSEKESERVDNCESSNNMELSGSVVEPLPATGTVAEPPVAEPKLLPKNYLLILELQALLDASVNALKDDASGQNTQKVLLNVLTLTLQLAAMRADATDAETQSAMLEVLERSAQFVEANVSVPQFNSKEATGVRTLVFNVYHRLAKVLGRNTPEAVKADTRAMLAAASDRISYKTPPGRKPKTYKPAEAGELEGPELHIKDVIEPILDLDMKSFAYEMSTYYIESLRSFYGVLGKWKSENKLKLMMGK